MAPFGPAPQIVSKEMSRSAPVAARICLEPLHHVDLGQPALGRGERRARRGTRPSPRRRAGARRGRRRSRPGSCSPWAGCRGRAPRPPPPRRRRRAGRRPRPARWPRSTPTRPRQRVEPRRRRRRGGATRDLGAEVRARAPRRPCAGSAKSSTRASAWRMAKASGTGVRAMSEPRTLRSQAIESGSVSTAAARSRATRPRAISARLSAEAAPGERVRVRHDRPRRRRRLVGPDPVDQVRHPHQPDLPRRRAPRLRLSISSRGVQPGVEAEPAAAGQRRGQPVGRLVLGDAHDLEAVGVDLAAHLQPVAAVDEDGGAVAR